MDTAEKMLQLTERFCRAKRFKGAAGKRAMAMAILNGDRIEIEQIEGGAGFEITGPTKTILDFLSALKLIIDIIGGLKKLRKRAPTREETKAELDRAGLTQKLPVAVTANLDPILGELVEPD